MYFGPIWLGPAWSGPVRPGPARVRPGFDHLHTRYRMLKYARRRCYIALCTANYSYIIDRSSMVHRYMTIDIIVIIMIIISIIIIIMIINMLIINISNINFIH